jgi:hypothetical protein
MNGRSCFGKRIIILEGVRLTSTTRKGATQLVQPRDTAFKEMARLTFEENIITTTPNKDCADGQHREDK